MKQIYILLLSLSMFLFSVEPAHANNPPGPQEFLLTFMIPLVIVIITTLGGGYDILRRIKEDKKQPQLQSFLNLPSTVIVIIVSLFFSIVYFGFVVIFAFMSGIWALQRVYVLYRWGRVAKSADNRPAYLAGANPFRLFGAAGALFVATLILLSGISFFGYYTAMTPMIDRESYTLKDVVAREMAKIRFPEDAKKSGESKLGYNLIKEKRLLIERDPGGKKFTVYLLPPYANFLARGPSYRADETGKIRKINVSSKDKRCPPDAPVYDEIEESDIEAAQRQMRR